MIDRDTAHRWLLSKGWRRSDNFFDYYHIRSWSGRFNEAIGKQMMDELMEAQQQDD